MVHRRLHDKFNGISRREKLKELTRWAGVVTLKQFGTGLIAWKSGTDLKIHFSDSESETSRNNVPTHRPLDIHGGHTSMDTLPDKGYR